MKRPGWAVTSTIYQCIDSTIHTVSLVGSCCKSSWGQLQKWKKLTQNMEILKSMNHYLWNNVILEFYSIWWTDKVICTCCSLFLRRVCQLHASPAIIIQFFFAMNSVIYVMFLMHMVTMMDSPPSATSSAVGKTAEDVDYKNRQSVNIFIHWKLGNLLVKNIWDRAKIK